MLNKNLVILFIVGKRRIKLRSLKVISNKYFLSWMVCMLIDPLDPFLCVWTFPNICNTKRIAVNVYNMFIKV